MYQSRNIQNIDFDTFAVTQPTYKLISSRTSEFCGATVILIFFQKAFCIRTVYTTVTTPQMSIP